MNQEEEYLNQMARKGYFLVKYSSLGFYTFAEGRPEDLNYRVDYRFFSKKSDFEEYVSIFEDAGWIHVWGKPFSGSQYFLPQSDELADEDIFSDRESKSERSRRLSRACFINFAVCLVYTIAEMIICRNNNWSLFSMRSWYFTPGIWFKTGAKFWSAFLFETPFVILRVFPIFFFALLGLIYAYWAIKARMLDS